jgi:hypothetical protein
LTFCGVARRYRQYSLPVSASTATTLLAGSVKYITPSITSGVVSTTVVVFIWYTHFTFRLLTFSRLI